MKNAFFSFNFLNKDILLNIFYTVFKMYMLILDTMMEGSMSQIFKLGARFYLMKCRKKSLKK